MDYGTISAEFERLFGEESCEGNEYVMRNERGVAIVYCLDCEVVKACEKRMQEGKMSFHTKGNHITIRRVPEPKKKMNDIEIGRGYVDLSLKEDHKTLNRFLSMGFYVAYNSKKHHGYNQYIVYE